MSSPNHTVASRLLLPDDANPAGNVHGGTILRLMEEAGLICATRYMGRRQDGAAIGALVRFENMSFHQPIFVGDVASIDAKVIFTSERSILVKVVVTAEQLVSHRTPRVTNTGELWYVALETCKDKNWKWKPGGVQHQGDAVRVSVPPLPVPSEEEDKQALKEYNLAKKSYDRRKASQQSGHPELSKAVCLNMDGCLCPKCRSSYKAPSEGRTSAASEQRLSQMVLPGDCWVNNVSFGGFVMKLMDNAAGCSAFRHARTNVVTVAISAMDFVHWVQLGNICSIQARVVFCSHKSMEIEVTASVTTIHNIDGDDKVVAKGSFTFVSLNAEGKAIPVPPVILETEQDFDRAFHAQQKYEMAKRRRAQTVPQQK